MLLIPKPVLVTAPTEDAVSLTELKTHIRVDGTADDTALTIMLRSVIKHVEAITDKKLVTQTWDIYFDDFPSTRSDDWWDGEKEGAISSLRKPGKYLELPFGPLQSVSSIVSIDEDNTEHTFETTNWQADTIGPVPQIALKTGGAWPATVLRPLNGVKIRGVFGYGAAAAIPQDIKQAILMCGAHLYENRGDAEAGDAIKTPPAAMALLNQYRRIKVG